MGACPTLSTERLVLRPFVESDLDAFTEIFLTPEVHAALHLPDSFSRENVWAGMVSWLGQWELRGTGQWAIEERAGGTLVGRAGLHRPERADWPGIEVGWVLDPRQWGHGYATEAGECAVTYAFEVIGADEVFSVILPENRRSEAVAARLGFTLVEQRVMSHFPESPHGIWRLGRDEWEHRTAPVVPSEAGESISADGARRRPTPRHR